MEFLSSLVFHTVLWTTDSTLDKFFEIHGITRIVTVWNTNEDENSMFLFVYRWQYFNIYIGTKLKF